MTTPEAIRRPQSVLVLVHDPDRRILLIRRRDFGFWQSVTGSMLSTESDPAVTAKREVGEETGLDVDAGDLVDLGSRARFLVAPAMRGRFAPGVRYNTEYQFSLQVASAAPVRLDPREHDACSWCDPGVARAMLWSWSNRLALDRFMAIA